VKQILLVFGIGKNILLHYLTQIILMKNKYSLKLDLYLWFKNVYNIVKKIQEYLDKGVIKPSKSS